MTDRAFEATSSGPRRGRRPLTGMTARAIAALAMIGVLLSIGQAAAGAKPANRHCIHPSGADMNAVAGTNDRIITSFCTVALVGEHWIPESHWITNTAYEFIPPGFTPLFPSPMDDFKAKFTGGRYVVDAGTTKERTYKFTASQILKTGFTVPGTNFPLAEIMPVLHPLPPGPHIVDIFLSISADTWDGLGVDPAANLWPAGEKYCTRYAFTVVTKNS